MLIIKYFSKRFLVNVFTVLVTLLLLLLSGSTLAAPETIDVPSGVPTEAPGTPATLGVPDTTLTILGCAAPNAFVTLFEDNEPAGTVIAAANGTYSKTLLSRAHGLHTMKAYYEDSFGRRSSSVSKNVSVAPHANTSLNLFMAPTVEVDPSTLNVGDIVVFRGSTAPFATVNVTIDNNTTVVAKANALGNWSVSVDTEDFFVGTHVYRAISSSPACGTSEASATESFVVTRPLPEDFLTDGPNDIIAPIITEPSDQFLASDPNVLIVGSAQPNSQLELWVDGLLAGSVFANARGEWAFPFTMSSDQHQIEARMCIDGECSLASNQITLYYRGDFNGCDLFFRLENYRFFGVLRGGGVDIRIEELTGSGRYEMLIDWGDTTIEHLNLYRDSQNKFHHVYNKVGQFNGVITIEDSNGCEYTQYISAVVEPRDIVNWWWLLLLTIPPSMVFAYRQTRHVRHVRVRYINP